MAKKMTTIYIDEDYLEHVENQKNKTEYMNSLINRDINETDGKTVLTQLTQIIQLAKEIKKQLEG